VHYIPLPLSQTMDYCVSYRSVEPTLDSINSNSFSDNKSNLYEDDDDDEFKIQLCFVIPSIFQNLKVLKFHNKNLNGMEYLKYIEECILKYQSKQLLVTSSSFHAVIEKDMENIAKMSYEIYKNKFYSAVSKICNESDVERAYDDSKREAVANYTASRKMGKRDEIKKFEGILIKHIDEDYKQYMLIVKPHLMNSKKLQEEMSELRKSHEKELNHKNDLIIRANAEFDTKLRTNESEIRTLTLKLKSADIDNESSVRELKIKENVIRKMTIEKEEMSQEIKNLQSRIQNKRDSNMREIDRYRKDINCKNLEIVSKDGEIRYLNNKLYSLTTDFNELTQNNNQKRAEIEELNRNMEQLKSDHKKEVDLLKKQRKGFFGCGFL
jgi:chromosome segregation ATPase